MSVSALAQLPRVCILAFCFWLDSRYSFRNCHRRDSWFHKSWNQSWEFAHSVVTLNQRRLLSEFIYYLILQ